MRCFIGAFGTGEGRAAPLRLPATDARAGALSKGARERALVCVCV